MPGGCMCLVGLILQAAAMGSPDRCFVCVLQSLGTRLVAGRLHVPGGLSFTTCCVNMSLHTLRVFSFVLRVFFCTVCAGGLPKLVPGMFTYLLNLNLVSVFSGLS